jgi:protein tyrosine kinase modulator
VPLALLFLVARFDPRARSADLLGRNTGLPVLATVPYYRGPRDDVIDRKRNVLVVLLIVLVLAAYVGLYAFRILRGT